MPRMKTINDLLRKDGSPLAPLLQKLQASRPYEAVFYAVLDPELTQHCRYAHYLDGELTLIATNSAWATRLRYTIPDLIKQLRVQPEFHELKKIRYMVDLSRRTSPKPRRSFSKLSSENEKLWKKTLAALQQQFKNRKPRHKPHK